MAGDDHEWRERQAVRKNEKKTERERESHALRGPIDRSALLAIRDEFDTREPLATPSLDDFVNPTLLEVEFDDGLLDASDARIDVAWTTRSDYKFHYTDAEGLDLRWGNHRHGGTYVHASGTEHFHPPPDAASVPEAVADSCIEQSPPKLVTWAVLELWRNAYDDDSLEALNSATNPP